MKLHDKVYDIMKWVVIIALPAFSTFYAALANIWGFPEADKVVGTITALTLLLGLLLGVSTLSYNKSDAKYDGSLNVEQTEDKLVYTLDVGDALENLASKKSISLKVTPLSQ